MARAVKLVLRLVLQIRHAGTPVQARFLHAARQLHRAVLATPQSIAIADVIVAPIHTRTMYARPVLETLVNVRLTVRTLEALVAIARVVTDTVDTDTVLARTTIALVDVGLAVRTDRTRDTDALVTGRQRVRERLTKVSRQSLRSDDGR
uniref:Putative secreted protein n=1 Tax=Anopheles darlingi TaxID=43151 RepID=A0A2M4DBW5_ANODA